MFNISCMMENAQQAPELSFDTTHAQHSCIDWLGMGHVTVQEEMWEPPWVDKKMYVLGAKEAFSNEINSCAWLQALGSSGRLLFSHRCPNSPSTSWLAARNQ